MSIDSIEMPLKTKILRKQLELLAERAERSGVTRSTIVALESGRPYEVSGCP